MKIVFVTPYFLPHLGGVEIHVKEIATILVKMGHEVNIVTSQHSDKLPLKSKANGVSIFRLPHDVWLHKMKTWRAVQEHTKLFFDADVIHVHDVFWWILPIYVANRKKIFTTFHGWETRFPIPLAAKIHRLLAAKLSRGTIHVGNWIQQFYFDKPTAVTYGGINAKRFTKSNTQRKVSNSQLQFVFVGRLEKDTDIEKYVELLSVLSNSGLSFSMTWVGDGSLRGLCEKYGTVTGFVKNVSKYVVPCDLVFASSYLSILESQLLKKVVCSFYSNELKKAYLFAYPGTASMLIAKDVESMQKQITHLFSLKNNYKHCAELAYAFAQKQTWEEVVNTYLSVWKLKK